MNRLIAKPLLRHATFAFAIMLMAAANVAFAQTKPQQVSFAKGSDTATFKGKLKGPASDSKEYLVDLKSGQKLTISLVADKKNTTYFNLLPPAKEGVPRRETEGQSHTESSVTADGAYTVRVFLTRDASRDKVSSSFVLTIKAS